MHSLDDIEISLCLSLEKAGIILKTLSITNQSQIVDAEECPPLKSTELNSVDWATEQSKDVTLSRVIYLLKSGYNPQNTCLQNEDINVFKYLEEAFFQKQHPVPNHHD